MHAIAAAPAGASYGAWALVAGLAIAAGCAARAARYYRRRKARRSLATGGAPEVSGESR
jgi:hypothetical protein